MKYELTAPQRRTLNEEMLTENVVVQAASMALAGLLKGVEKASEGMGRGVGAAGRGAGEAVAGAGEAVAGAGEAIRGAAPGVGSGAGEFARGAGDLGFGVGTAVRGIGDAISNILHGVSKRIGVIFYNDDVEKIKTIIRAQKLQAQAGIKGDEIAFKRVQAQIKQELELAVQKNKARQKTEKS